MEAKKWKDTVMSDKQIKEIKVWGKPTGSLVDVFQYLLEHQAEISFKAGIREVVEWIEGQMLIAGYNITTGKDIGMISKGKWQAKLKDWGIK